MIITISRQSATNGMFVAQLVAERLNYRVFDSEFVDEIARRSQVDPSILQRFDEQTVNPVSSVLWEWRSSLSTESYMRYLRETLHAVAREGNAIIVGRGANFILRGTQYLHVRMVAPLELRIAMYCSGEGVSEREARRWVHEQDELRAAYIRKYFHNSIENPAYYDLIVNLDSFTLESVADLIVQAVRTHSPVEMTPEKIQPEYIQQLAFRRPIRRPAVVEPVKVRK